MRTEVVKLKELVRPKASRFFQLLKCTIGLVPPERVFRHLHFVGPFDLALPNGGKVKLYSWGHRVENELAWRGWDGHEPEERQCWAAMIQDGGDVLDVGANTATFAITAKGLSPQSRVFAIEPVQRIAEMARQNVIVSGLEIGILCCALARSSGQLPIFDPGGENAYSASLDADFLPGEKESYMVPVISLDDFCKENGVDPTAIKLDVEGYEGEVICGGVELLRRGRCAFLCEWLGESRSHVEARRLLSENGYIALDVHDLAEADLVASKDFGDRNLILVHRERVRRLIDQIGCVRG